MVNRETLKRLYWDERKSISEISEELGMTTSAIYWRMKKWEIPRRSPKEGLKIAREKGKGRHPDAYSKREEEILREHYKTMPREELLDLLPNRSWESIKTKASKMNLERDIYHNRFIPRYNKTLSYVLGVIYGDGWVCESGRKGRDVKEKMVGLENRNKKFVQSFVETLEDLGLHAYVTEKEKYGKKFYRGVSYSSSFVEWFEELDFSEVQDFVSEDSFFYPFVRGFYESEGSICRPKKKTCKEKGKGWRSHIQIRMYNTNKELLSFISSGLNERGIKSRIYLNREKGEDYKIRGRQVTRKKNLWMIVMSGVKHTKKFLKKVSPVFKNNLEGSENE